MKNIICFMLYITVFSSKIVASTTKKNGLDEKQSTNNKFHQISYDRHNILPTVKRHLEDEIAKKNLMIINKKDT